MPPEQNIVINEYGRFHRLRPLIIIGASFVLAVAVVFGYHAIQSRMIGGVVVEEPLESQIVTPLTHDEKVAAMQVYQAELATTTDNDSLAGYQSVVEVSDTTVTDADLSGVNAPNPMYEEVQQQLQGYAASI